MSRVDSRIVQQSGPPEHATVGKAAAFGIAASADFREQMERVVTGVSFSSSDYTRRNSPMHIRPRARRHEERSWR
ncbi:hypothetical protein APR04_004637 [Promicromonospora umidemergens]|uniref:Uncharacterized protein n=1 Tax=Promicromonospora umidemergens TaxID=629679 RepID=A0ABP8YE26_9MICO|nr:hypothetical protein [Promicromonospora umidemergens]MCP2285576.1 hypothetical protein [Promicromonospora umidemergens]MCP2285702.1 hypothetical protein [Promicromonospora umidemergens]